MLAEIRTEEYKTRKTELDAEIDRVRKVNARLSSGQAALDSERKANQLAEIASDTDTLTKPPVEILIKKILVYPEQKYEVVWNNETHKPALKILHKNF